MNLPHVMRAVLDQPWAILPQKLDAVLAVLSQRAAGRYATAEDIRAALGGEGVPQARASIGGGVAVLPLQGLIVPRASGIEESSGVQSLQRFGAWVDEATANEQVHTLLLDVDSPGGSVALVAETWAKLMAARSAGKRVVAHVNSLAASAGYWIASAADEIVCTPSGEVGAIGVITVRADYSKAEMEGASFHVLTSGRYKAEGHPLTPFTDEEKAATETRLDEFYSMFTGHVAKGRGVAPSAVRSGFGEGRLLSASAAKAAGMVDKIATFEDTLARLTTKRSVRVATRAQANQPGLAAALHVPTTSTTGVAPTGFLTINLTGGMVGSDVTASDILAAVADVPASPPAVSAVSGGEPAPSADPLPEPAPKAKEHVMSETVTAAASGGANDEVIRLKGYNALRREHPEITGKLDEWEGAGLSLDAATTNVRKHLQDQLKASPAPTAAPAPRIEVGLPNESKRPWKGAGEFYASVITAYSPGGTVDPRLFAAATGMSQGVPSDGGFAVLPEFANTIYEGLTSDPNALLPMTDSYTVTGESITFPANAETSRATGSRYGGVRGYWISEAAQITSSAPKLRQVKIEPQQMAVLVYLTEKLMRNNAVGLEQYVNRAASEELTFLAGDAIINGTGVGQPKGILASGCTVSVAKETSQVAATFVKANANKMWARLHPRSRANAVWLMNVDVEPQLDDFNTLVKNVAGSENVGGFASQIYNAEKNTLKGRPIIYTEFNATLGTVGDVILADMKGYLTGIRGGVEQAVSMHLRFDYAEQALRFMYELDGQTWLNSAITPYKGSNTLSSFVTVATRS